MTTRHGIALAVILIPLASMGGCPGITVSLPDGGLVTIPNPLAQTVTVEVFNDTDFEVDPRIRFDDDTGFPATWFPSEELATGILRSGESIQYTIDCDELGLIFSDSAGQFLFNDTIGQADQTRVLERDDEYDCGDVILFRFIGSGDGFGTIVAINGVVVD